MKPEYNVTLIKACWYNPDEDPLLTADQKSKIHYDPNMPYIEIEVADKNDFRAEKQRILISEDVFNQGTQVDGDVLFIYEPPEMPENPGLFDRFEFPQDYDSEYRDNLAIARMRRSEVQKARQEITQLRIQTPPPESQNRGFTPS